MTIRSRIDANAEAVSGGATLAQLLAALQQSSNADVVDAISTLGDRVETAIADATAATVLAVDAVRVEVGSLANAIGTAHLPALLNGIDEARGSIEGAIAGLGVWLERPEGQVDLIRSSASNSEFWLENIATDTNNASGSLVNIENNSALLSDITANTSILSDININIGSGNTISSEIVTTLLDVSGSIRGEIVAVLENDQFRHGEMMPQLSLIADNSGQTLLAVQELHASNESGQDMLDQNADIRHSALLSALERYLDYPDTDQTLAELAAELRNMLYVIALEYGYGSS